MGTSAFSFKHTVHNTMDKEDINMRNLSNQEIRNRYNEFYEAYYRPNMRLVADAITMDHHYLIKFKNNKIDIGLETLQKIDEFLDKHGY